MNYNFIKKLKEKLNLIASALQIVFQNKKYFVIVFLISFLILFFLNLAINYRLIFSEFFFNMSLLQKLFLLVSLFEGVFVNNTLLTIISQLLIGILTGINISMIHFKYKLNKSISEKEGFISSVAAFLGLLAGGCATCSLTIATILGVNAFFIFFPFGGFELTVVAIMLLFFAMYSASKSVIGICKVKN